MELKRKIYDKLLLWKKKDGQTALLIEGARRVGKSTITEIFARNEYKSFILIDFSIAPKEVKDFFITYGNDLDSLFLNLSLYYKKELFNRNSLLIFDEIQFFPKARELLKHLVKDHRYDYIETGSLISIKQNVKDILIPSEEEKIVLYPLDFEEFCWALGDKVTIPFLKDSYLNRKPLGRNLKIVMDRYRLYLAIGGMPGPIIKYAETKDFSCVDSEKRNIIELYKNDIAKFSSPYIAQAENIFEKMPIFLSKHDKTISFYGLDKHGRFSSYDDAILWFSESKVANIAYGVKSLSIDFVSINSKRNMKCYMGDTGLLMNLSYGEKIYIDNPLYKAIIQGSLSTNKGMIIENAVAQALASNNHSLNFYKNSENNIVYEIDFLIKKDGKLCPIEVKSSHVGKLSSLHYVKNKYKNEIGQSYVLSPGDLREKDGILFLPLPMAMFL